MKSKIIQTDENVEKLDHQTKLIENLPSINHHRWQIIWPMLIALIFLHIEAIIGFILGITHAHIVTLIWFFILIQFGATGIICGAHRLWTHRAYKANSIFRTFLMLCNTLAMQVCSMY